MFIYLYLYVILSNIYPPGYKIMLCQLQLIYLLSFAQGRVYRVRSIVKAIILIKQSRHFDI